MSFSHHFPLTGIPRLSTFLTTTINRTLSVVREEKPQLSPPPSEFSSTLCFQPSFNHGQQRVPIRRLFTTSTASPMRSSIRVKGLNFPSFTLPLSISEIRSFPLSLIQSCVIGPWCSPHRQSCRSSYSSGPTDRRSFRDGGRSSGVAGLL